MSNETLIRKAEFDPKVCTYWLISGAIAIAVTVVGIPLLLLWFPIGMAVTRRYLSRMECELTNKALKVKKGILVRVEKTIPIEKITDMGMVQGPLMRMFDLRTLSVETAGQSGQGALVSLTGIVDAESFREAVLAQREVAGATNLSALATSDDGSRSTSGSDAVLLEIRDSLHRIERLLEKTSN